VDADRLASSVAQGRDRCSEWRQVVHGNFVSCCMACRRRPVARHQIAYRSVHGSPRNSLRQRIQHAPSSRSGQRWPLM